MEKQFNLLIDTKRTNYNNIRGLKQGDNNSVLNITLVQDSIPFNLENCSVRINYKRPDNKIFLQMADVVSTQEGKIKVNVLTKVLEIDGEVKSDLSIFDKDNRKITSVTFNMFVEASVYTNDYLEPEDLDIIQDIYVKENERIANEKIRVENEDIRKLNESNRIEKENIRIKNEDDRKSNESIRVKNENNRMEKEDIRVGNENTRLADENIRKSNEDERIKNEINRKSNEGIRVKNESDRMEKDRRRVENEIIRVENEDARKSNEDERIKNENIRIKAETARISNENNRMEKENIRVQNENVRKSNESVRIKNETNRVSEFETIKSDYETLKSVIVDENNVANLQEQINKHEEQLKENATKEVSLKNNIEHLDGGVNGILNINSIGGNTLYKREDGTYTDTWEENVELESVKDKIEITSCGKNLFNINDYIVRKDEIVENIPNGIRIIADKCSWSSIHYYLSVKQQTDYIFKCNVHTVKKCIVQIKQNDGTFFYNINCSEGNNVIEKTISNPNNSKLDLYIILQTDFDKELDDVNKVEITNIQIEEGTQATTYEPYKVDKTTIQLKEPLRSLPNGVADEIQADGTLVRRVSKVVLDGSEKWHYLSQNDTFILFYLNKMAKPNKPETSKTAMSDKFPYKVIYSFENTDEGMFVSIFGHIMFRIYKSKLSTADIGGFTQWLKDNPTTLLYELKEPIIENIETLKPLKCWKDGSLSVSSNINPIVHFKYPTNLNSRLSSVEENTLNNSNFVKEQNAINLQFDFENNLLSKTVEKHNIQLENKADKEELNNLKTETESQLADMTQQIENIDLSADKIKIADKNNKFNSTEVEGALYECITKAEEAFIGADNGKKNWVDVIGSPLSTEDNFSTLKSKTQNLKNTFASNLSSKGQSATGTEGLNSLISKIKNIEHIKIAEGIIPNVNSSTGEIKIEGLAFTPDLVIMWALRSKYPAYLSCGIYDSFKNINRSVKHSEKNSGDLYDDVFYVENNSVKLNNNWSIVNNNFYDVNWIALKR